jgi:hypothetical protein
MVSTRRHEQEGAEEREQRDPAGNGVDGAEAAEGVVLPHPAASQADPGTEPPTGVPAVLLGPPLPLLVLPDASAEAEQTPVSMLALLNER